MKVEGVDAKKQKVMEEKQTEGGGPIQWAIAQ